MLDKLYYSDEEGTGTGLTITKENIFTKNGQFTEPGIVEHMAQAIAIRVGYYYDSIGKPAPTGYIGAIKNLVIYRLPKVNEEIRTEIKILHEILGVTIVAVRATCNGQLVAETELKTVLEKK